MGVGTFYRNIKHLSGKDIGSADASADHSGTGAVSACIRSLGCLLYTSDAADE